MFRTLRSIDHEVAGEDAEHGDIESCVGLHVAKNARDALADRSGFAGSLVLGHIWKRCQCIIRWRMGHGVSAWGLINILVLSIMSHEHTAHLPLPLFVLVWKVATKQRPRIGKLIVTVSCATSAMGESALPPHII